MRRYLLEYLSRSDLAFQPERIRHPPHPPRGIHEQHVESHPCPAPRRVRRQRSLSRSQQPRALARTERRRGTAQRRAALHLHEGKQAVALGHQIQLARLCTQAPGKNLPALPLKRRRGERLGVEAACMPGQDRSRPSSAAWQATSTSPARV